MTLAENIFPTSFRLSWTTRPYTAGWTDEQCGAARLCREASAEVNQAIRTPLDTRCAIGVRDD
jgi:hypothetical protein